jgi:hypothetical protein
MIDEAKIMEKVNKLTPRERERMAYIMLAMPKMMEALLSCASPDDARIALCAVIGSVFGLQVAPGNRWSAGKLAEVTTEFIVEAFIARRSYAKSFRPDTPN